MHMVPSTGSPETRRGGAPFIRKSAEVDTQQEGHSGQGGCNVLLAERIRPKQRIRRGISGEVHST